MARLPKDFLATGFRGNREKKSVAPHYLSEPFTSALAPLCGPLDFFCHIIWRQREGSTKRAKRGKKATPRYVAEPFASLRCIDKGFRGICATLSGGNPPRYETNHRFGGDIRTRSHKAGGGGIPYFSRFRGGGGGALYQIHGGV